MQPIYQYGDEVRLIRNVRNDGTYPGMAVGEFLVKRGSVGCVYDVGSYLQDQIIYRVHFLSEGKTVGCREEELVLASDPWISSLFEYSETVIAKVSLAVKGNVVVNVGDKGQVTRVLRETPNGVQYEIHFGGGRMFQVPESALAAPQTVES
jgi:nitrogen fixation protein NifZ